MCRQLFSWTAFLWTVGVDLHRGCSSCRLHKGAPENTVLAAELACSDTGKSFILYTWPMHSRWAVVDSRGHKRGFNSYGGPTLLLCFESVSGREKALRWPASFQLELVPPPPTTYTPCYHFEWLVSFFCFHCRIRGTSSGWWLLWKTSSASPVTLWEFRVLVSQEKSMRVVVDCQGCLKDAARLNTFSTLLPPVGAK